MHDPETGPLPAGVRAPQIVPFAIGDRLTLRKPHPCGSTAWTVTRVGADIGIVCGGCGRRVLLERREIERRLAGRLEPAAPAGPPEVPKTSGADR